MRPGCLHLRRRTGQPDGATLFSPGMPPDHHLHNETREVDPTPTRRHAIHHTLQRPRATFTQVPSARRAGRQTTPEIDRGFMASIYFRDPWGSGTNGLLQIRATVASPIARSCLKLTLAVSAGSYNSRMSHRRRHRAVTNELKARRLKTDPTPAYIRTGSRP